MTKGKIYIIEGAIGAGKSSFVDSTFRHSERIFGKDSKVVVIREDVYFPLLGMCIADPKRNAMPFQAVVARDRLETMREAMRYYRQGCVVLIDRGLPGDIAFARLHAKLGNISESEMGIYYGLLQHGVPDFVPKSVCDVSIPVSPVSTVKVRANFALPNPKTESPDDVKILHLSVSPEVAFARMKKRGIESEVKGYDIDYFRELGETYEEVLKMFEKDWGSARMHTVDHNGELPLDEEGQLALGALMKIWGVVG